MKQVLNIWALLFALMALPAHAVQAQQVKINHYSTAEGLSGRLTNCLYQDAQGYIWVGTRNGINRFNGKNFRSASKSNSDLPDNLITEIQPGPSDDWLTIRHQSGYSLINTSTMEIRSIADYFKEEPGTNGRDFDYFFRAGPGIFYLKDKDDIIYEAGNGQPLEKLIDLRQENLDFNVIFFSPEGAVWLETAQFSIALDEPKKLDHRVETDHLNHPVFRPPYGASLFPLESTGETASHIYEHRVTQGLVPFLSIDELRQELTDIPEAFGIILLSGTRQAPKYWLVANGYLKSYDSHSKKSIDFDSLLNRSYEVNEYSDFLVDNSGLTWISTNDGIFTVEFQPLPFQSYLNSETAAEWMSIRTMIRLGDKLIATSYSQNRSIDLKSGTVELVDPERRFRHLLNDYASSFHLAADSSLWFGGFHLVRHDLKANTADVIPFHNVIWTLYEDPKGILYAGAENGLYKVNRSSQEIEKSMRNGQHEFEGNHIHQIYEDRSGKIWVLTGRGLYQWSVSEGVIAHYHRKGIESYFLPENEILSLYEAEDGSFWLATKGSGIIHFHPEQGMIRNYSTRDGLSNNVTYGILPDDHGFLWVSSDYGLMRFSPETGNVKTFLKEDGLPHNEFNTNAYYKDWEGNMYFGGLNGLIRFHPDSIARLNEFEQPALQITGYRQLNGSSQKMEDRTADFLTERKITLPYQERSFALSVLMLDYRNTNDIRYAYRMEGVADNWVFQPDNEIRFQGVNPGSCTLEIKGVNNQGGEGASILSIPVRVMAPFYQQSWFILTIVVLVFGLIYLRIYLLRQSAKRLKEEVAKSTRQIQEDKEVIEQQASELVELDMAKSQFFTNVSHELRTPLSLIYGPLQALKRKSGLDESVAGALEKIELNSIQLKELVEEILDLSRLDSNKVELKLRVVDIHDWLHRIVMPWEDRVASVEKHFAFQNSIKEKYLQIDEKKLEKIIYNLISNALKFTPTGGHIEVEADWAADRLTLKVKDDGQGIALIEQERIFDRYYQSLKNKDKPMGGLGIGLNMSSEFAHLMEGSLRVDSEAGMGSTFTMDIHALAFDQPAADDLTDSDEVWEIERPIPTLDNTYQDATILLVEDHDEMRDFVSRVLEPYFKVISRPNGKAALHLLQENPAAVDAIISDIMMPEMDGFELLARVKKDPDLYLKPVILLTARAGKEDRLNALRIGVDDYLTKPFLPDELVIRTQNLLRYRKQVPEEDVPDELEESEKEGQEEIETLTPGDLDWLSQAEEFVIKHINDSRLSADFISEHLYVSRRHLSRKLKALTGLNTTLYIQEVRLQQARTLMENGQCRSVKEVAIEVGFKKVDYFSKLFTQRMGRNPSAFLS